MFGNKKSTAKSATQRRQEADQRYIRAASKKGRVNSIKAKRAGGDAKKALSEEQTQSGGSTTSNPLTRKRLGLPPLQK